MIMLNVQKPFQKGFWLNTTLILLAGLLISLAVAKRAHAGEVRVAVAANFAMAVKEIGALYKKATNHKAIFSFGSTGQLYTQITQGAPFEVFLAADQVRPQQAVKEGFAVPESRFTYVTGKIVLFSTNKELVIGQETLAKRDFTKLAIANPMTAPYGAAAVQTMKELGIYNKLAPKIVQGNSIAQTYQFVETGNAEIGFVALSQVAHHNNGSRWIVPDNLYSTIAQDAVLLKRGANNQAARAFLTFLKGSDVRKVKEKYGYGGADN